MAEAPDPSCQDPDCGKLVANESGGVEIVEMAPSVTWDVNFWELSDMAQIDNIKVAMEFICGLEAASLDVLQLSLYSCTISHPAYSFSYLFTPLLSEQIISHCL